MPQRVAKVQVAVVLENNDLVLSRHAAQAQTRVWALNLSRSKLNDWTKNQW
jgi:hypothetical protein